MGKMLESWAYNRLLPFNELVIYLSKDSIVSSDSRVRSTVNAITIVVVITLDVRNGFNSVKGAGLRVSWLNCVFLIT